MIHRKLLYLLFVLFTISSCHKDEVSENEETTTTFTAEVVQEITGKIVGYVYDENNRPVEGAVVQIYSATTRTNKFGVFVFDNAKMDKQGTYITARKSGFILGSDLVYPDTKSTALSRIGLLALETSRSFDAGQGGTIAISGGGKIEFPAEAIGYNDGSGYSGTVYVTAKLLSPDNPKLEEIMPGGLIGDAANGATVALGSAGMVVVELRDDKGEELNLRSGKKAAITIPASTENKPATIALWSFDESKGRWKEEGIATLVGDNYTAEVSHFSFWNCDAPFPLVDVCGKVVDENGNPLSNVYVNVYPEGLYASAGVTNSDGVFCGKMPKGVKLTFKLSTSYCGTIVFEKMVEPLFQATILDPFVINSNSDNNTLKIKGQVTCSGTPVEDALLVISFNDQHYIFPANLESGSIFNFDLSYLLCNQSINGLKIFAFDNVSGKSSNEVVVTPGPDPVTLNFDICANACDFNANFDYDCNDILSIIATGGSGNFKYLWNNGSKERQIKLESDSLFGIYCVTVTDEGASGCTKTFCKQVYGPLEAEIEGGCWGTASAFVGGGLAPYTYLWSTGQTTREINISSSGTYCVTITDQAGCTVKACKDIIEDVLFVDPNPVSCSENTFSLNSSPFAGGNIWTNNGTIIQQLTSLNNLNVFETGFNFSLLIYGQQCEAQFSIQLPRNDSINADAINPTCGTCKDGWIEYNIGNTCYSCTNGPVIILTADGSFTNVTAQNNAKTLGKGFYYVVLTDANTGCYVGFRKVELKI